MMQTTSPDVVSRKSISAGWAAWLLIRLRLRRQWNQVGSVFRHRMGSRDSKKPGRASLTMWLITAFVGLAMLGNGANLSYQAISNVEKVLGSVKDKVEQQKNKSRPSAAKPQQMPPAPGSVVSAGVLQGLIFITTLLLITGLLIAMANREIARPEWDLEWLATLPLPLSTLLASRLVERALTSAPGFCLLSPFLSVLAWTCGYRWSAPFVGVALTLPLLFLLAIAQTVYDTGLRLLLSPSRLRNLQATMSVLALPPLFLVMAPAVSETSFVFEWASAMPEWVNWLPPGLAVQVLAASGGGAWSLLLMIAEIAMIVAIGLMVLHRLLGRGVVAAGAREAVMRETVTPRRAAPVPKAGGLNLLSTVQRRELLLLARDRTFMVQTLLLPALMVGAQIFVSAGTTFTDSVSNPAHLALIAFGLAGSTLAFSAFQTLNAEGQSLWVLYCVPHSLESVLRQKARFWAAVAAVYPLVIFATAIAVARDISLEVLAAAVVVLVGVPIFATIATALGVFGCDPLEPDVQKRVRITYFYIYTMLASLYAYAIYAPSIWQRLAAVILTALVAMALWQKARDQFDYLLDPSASPPARVSVSDGLIAALMFFVLQALVVALQLTMQRTLIATADMIWIAFCIAGAVTFGLMRLVYWRSGARDVPRLLDAGVGRALALGVAGGMLAAIVGVAYLQAVISLDLFTEFRQATKRPDPSLAMWIAAGIIVAAPVFEEFIFRGLIFGGLRRSLNLPFAAIASAAIFAIVHPPVSVMPVFALGLCAAVVYEMTRMLAAPIVVHMVYNAAILAFQWGVMD